MEYFHLILTFLYLNLDKAGFILFNVNMAVCHNFIFLEALCFTVVLLHRKVLSCVLLDVRAGALGLWLWTHRQPAVALPASALRGRCPLAVQGTPGTPHTSGACAAGGSPEPGQRPPPLPPLSQSSAFSSSPSPKHPSSLTWNWTTCPRKSSKSSFLKRLLDSSQDTDLKFFRYLEL